MCVVSCVCCLRKPLAGQLLLWGPDHLAWSGLSPYRGSHATDAVAVAGRRGAAAGAEGWLLPRWLCRERRLLLTHEHNAATRDCQRSRPMSSQLDQQRRLLPGSKTRKVDHSRPLRSACVPRSRLLRLGVAVVGPPALAVVQKIQIFTAPAISIV